MSRSSSFVLSLTCLDEPGILASIAGGLARLECNVTESAQFADTTTGRFFMRLCFTAPRGLDCDSIGQSLSPVFARFSMTAAIDPAEARMRALVMVSKAGHCLSDLLYRRSCGELSVEIVGIVSNHETLRRLAESHGLPFHHLPVTRDTKDAQERRFADIIEDEGVDLVVLARYMQVLSPALCERLSGRAINIHHSLLPSFKGAKPYAEAHARGVKVIGATAHYVTSALDEGPIIEQAVIRVDHAARPVELVKMGRDAESLALARAVQWHGERRVFRNGDRTVVLR